MEISINSNTIEIDNQYSMLVKYIVNLSSMNSNYLKRMLGSMMDVNKNIILMRITGPALKVSLYEKPSTIRRPTAVWYVVDSDDRLADIKIRNMNIYNNYTKAGKIILKLETSNITKINITGKEQRIVTAQVLNDSVKKLGCMKRIGTENVASLNIVKLKCKSVNSIAGLTIMANKEELPFVVTENNYQKFKSWILLKKEEIKDIIQIDRKAPKDVVKGHDWALCVEGTQYIATERNVTEFELRKTEHKDGTNLSDFLNIFKEIIIKIQIALNYLYTLIKGMYSTMKKEKKTNRKRR